MTIDGHSMLFVFMLSMLSILLLFVLRTSTATEVFVDQYAQYNPSDADLGFVPSQSDPVIEPSLPLEIIVDPPPPPPSDPVPYIDPNPVEALPYEEIEI